MCTASARSYHTFGAPVGNDFAQSMDESHAGDIEVVVKWTSEECTVLMLPDETVEDLKRRLAGMSCTGLAINQRCHVLLVACSCRCLYFVFGACLVPRHDFQTERLASISSTVSGLSSRCLHWLFRIALFV